MKHVTIKDIAKELNVSVSTVSRAFNNAFDINPNTRNRILMVAKEMGYHPNPIAKRLYQKKSFQIGVIVPEFINDFFPQVIIGIQKVLEEKGYLLLIMQSNESYATEMKNLQKLEENMVDGLLISLCKETVNFKYYNQLYEKGMPMVFFNRVSEQIKAPKVVFNDYKWAYFAVEHLIKQGCKNIIHFAGFKQLSLSRERIRGYEKAMNKFQIDYDDSDIIETGFTTEKGEQAMQKLLDSGKCPDGIFAANDPVALGAMRTLKKAGIKIPEQVAIIGFSEANWSEMVEPKLSSVAQPTSQIGTEAANLLLKQLDESFNKELLTNVELDGKVVIRESALRMS